MINWCYSNGLIDYHPALERMEYIVNGIISGTCNDTAWLLEHPPIYTAGSGSDTNDLLSVFTSFPVYNSGRGGKHTYHGPGQRVVYLMLNLKKLFEGKPDIKKYVFMLEEVIIKTLQEFDVAALRREGRVGIWVISDGVESKIASIGIRIRKWVAYHGIAINIHPDLSHFNAIIPCGIKEFGVTSLKALGKDISMQEFDKVFKTKFEELVYVEPS